MSMLIHEGTNYEPLNLHQGRKKDGKKIRENIETEWQ